MPAGRPSKYKPEFAKQAEHLCKLGATDYEIAKFFGVNQSTIYYWQSKYEEFSKSIKTGKAELDERVERSLYHKATGYTFETEKVFQFQGEIVRAKVTEHVPPDATSMIFWLKNRRPEQWRDVKESKVDMTVTEQVKNDAESLKGRITSLTARSGDQGISRKPH